MNFVFSDSQRNFREIWVENYWKKFYTAVQDLPLHNSNVLCLASGEGEKEAIILKERYADISKFIVTEIDFRKLAAAQKNFNQQDPKVILKRLDMNSVDSSFLLQQSIDTVIILAYCSLPQNLLWTLLRNRTWFSFLERGGKLIIEPTFYGQLIQKDKQLDFFSQKSNEVFYYLPFFEDCFVTNIYNCFFIEIKSCILSPDILATIRAEDRLWFEEKFSNI